MRYHPGERSAAPGVACPAKTPVYRTCDNREPLDPLTGGAALGCCACRAAKHQAALAKYVRRCPTLPQGLPCSTIGAEELNFRVRDGTGCFPFAMAAETLWSCTVARTSRTAQWTAKHVCRKCGVSQASRPVSTGQLRALQRFHFRPINPVVYWGPYQVDPEGEFILRRASRLDAFSGYPFQT